MLVRPVSIKNTRDEMNTNAFNQIFPIRRIRLIRIQSNFLKSQPQFSYDILRLHPKITTNTWKSIENLLIFFQNGSKVEQRYRGPINNRRRGEIAEIQRFFRKFSPIKFSYSWETFVIILNTFPNLRQRGTGAKGEPCELPKSWWRYANTK